VHRFVHETRREGLRRGRRGRTGTNTRRTSAEVREVRFGACGLVGLAVDHILCLRVHLAAESQVAYGRPWLGVRVFSAQRWHGSQICCQQHLIHCGGIFTAVVKKDNQ
jgi:hypothetical protein